MNLREALGCEKRRIFCLTDPSPTQKRSRSALRALDVRSAATEQRQEHVILRSTLFNARWSTDGNTQQLYCWSDELHDPTMADTHLHVSLSVLVAFS